MLFVIRRLCRVEMCLDSVFLIPKLPPDLYLVWSLFLGSCMHVSWGVWDSDLKPCFFFNVQYVLWIRSVTSPVTVVVLETKTWWFLLLCSKCPTLPLCPSILQPLPLSSWSHDALGSPPITSHISFHNCSSNHSEQSVTSNKTFCCVSDN